MTTATFTTRSAADRLLDVLYVLAQVIWSVRGLLMTRLQLAAGLAGAAWLAGIAPGPLARLLLLIGATAVIGIDTGIAVLRLQAAAATPTPTATSTRPSSTARSAR